MNHSAYYDGHHHGDSAIGLEICFFLLKHQQHRQGPGQQVLVLRVTYGALFSGVDFLNLMMMNNLYVDGLCDISLACTIACMEIVPLRSS